LSVDDLDDVDRTPSSQHAQRRAELLLDRMNADVAMRFTNRHDLADRMNVVDTISAAPSTKAPSSIATTSLSDSAIGLSSTSAIDLKHEEIGSYRSTQYRAIAAAVRDVLGDGAVGRLYFHTPTSAECECS
jgi:hypothetical protein